jgi:hypothetical protein
MSFFKKITGSYDELWKAIIRPPRDDYILEELGILFNYNLCMITKIENNDYL